MKCVFPDGFMKRFQEWNPRINKEHLIWVTWALVVDAELRQEFDDVVDQVRRKLQNELSMVKKADSLDSDDV